MIIGIILFIIFIGLIALIKSVRDTGFWNTIIEIIVAFIVSVIIYVFFTELRDVNLMVRNK